MIYEPKPKRVTDSGPGKRHKYATNAAFRDGWDRIFGKKKALVEDCVRVGPCLGWVIPNKYEDVVDIRRTV